MQLVSLLLIALIAAVCIGAAYLSGSAGSPASLFAILFAVQMILSLLLLGGDLNGEYEGFLWLTAAIALFGAGFCAAGRAYSRVAGPRPRDAGVPAGGVYDGRAMGVTMLIMLALALVQPISAVYRLGYTALDLFTPQGLLGINSAAAKARYVSGNYLTSVYTQAFLTLVYLLPLIGGWNMAFLKRSKRRVLCAFTVAPSLFVLLTQNTKAAFIGAVLMFISSFLTAQIYRTGRFFRLGKRSLRVIIPLAAAFLVLNYASFILREGSVSTSIFGSINSKSLNYLLGQIPAFNYWFSTSAGSSEPTLGLRTFYSVSDALGLMKRTPGIYSTKLVTAHLNTNVYTAFRPLIEDFTVLGALGVVLGTGALSGLCFGRLRSGRAGSLCAAFTAAMYFYIFYAFITSPWAYASYSAAAVTFFVYLVIIKAARRKERLYGLKEVEKYAET